MKIKTKWFGTITGSLEDIMRFEEVIEDAARYNLEKGYIKCHGDLITECKSIKNQAYGQMYEEEKKKKEVAYREQKPQRDISTTAQTKRPAGASKTGRSKKQTGVHKESDNK